MTIKIHEDNNTVHKCVSTQDKHDLDLYIFTCELCSYERHLNMKTGETVLIDGGNDTVSHSGWQLKPALDMPINSN